MEVLDHMAVLFLVYWGTPILYPTGLHQFIFSPTVHNRSVFYLLSNTYFLSLKTAIPVGLGWYLVILIWISLVISDVEHLFYVLVSHLYIFLEKCLFWFSAHVLMRFFCYWVVWHYTFWILNPHQIYVCKVRAVFTILPLFHGKYINLL